MSKSEHHKDKNNIGSTEATKRIFTKMSQFDLIHKAWLSSSEPFGSCVWWICVKPVQNQRSQADRQERSYITCQEVWHFQRRPSVLSNNHRRTDKRILLCDPQLDLIPVRSRFDSGFIPVLSRFDPSSIAVWSRFDPGSIPVWSRFYTGFIPVLSRFDPLQPILVRRNINFGRCSLNTQISRIHSPPPLSISLYFLSPPLPSPAHPPSLPPPPRHPLPPLE